MNQPSDFVVDEDLPCVDGCHPQSKRIKLSHQDCGHSTTWYRRIKEEEEYEAPEFSLPQSLQDCNEVSQIQSTSEVLNPLEAKNNLKCELTQYDAICQNEIKHVGLHYWQKAIAFDAIQSLLNRNEMLKYQWLFEKHLNLLKEAYIETGRENEILRQAFQQNGMEIASALQEQNDQLLGWTSTDKIDLLTRALQPHKPLFINALREAELLDSKYLQMNVQFNNDKIKEYLALDFQQKDNQDKEKDAQSEQDIAETSQISSQNQLTRTKSSPLVEQLSLKIEQKVINKTSMIKPDGPGNFFNYIVKDFNVLTYDLLFTVLKCASVYSSKNSKQQEFLLADLPSLFADAFGWPSFSQIQYPASEIYYAMETMIRKVIDNRAENAKEILSGNGKQMIIKVPSDYEVDSSNAEEQLRQICVKNGQPLNSQIFKWRMDQNQHN